MDDKDTFHTFGYRGGYISTCWNRTQKVEEVTCLRYEGDKSKQVKSLIAAKQRISKFANKGK